MVSISFGTIDDVEFEARTQRTLFPALLGPLFLELVSWKPAALKMSDICFGAKRLDC